MKFPGNIFWSIFILCFFLFTQSIKAHVISKNTMRTALLHIFGRRGGNKYSPQLKILKHHQNLRHKMFDRWWLHFKTPKMLYAWFLNHQLKGTRPILVPQFVFQNRNANNFLRGNILNFAHRSKNRLTRTLIYPFLMFVAGKHKCLLKVNIMFRT